jgi:hypothetical protein
MILYMSSECILQLEYISPPLFSIYVKILTTINICYLWQNGVYPMFNVVSDTKFKIVAK